MALVKFFRGLKDNYVPATTHADSIYFATDTQELLLNNKAYGLSTADLGKLNGAVDSLDWVVENNTVYLKAITTNKGEEKYTSIPLASADHAGLMSMGHFSGLTTLMGDDKTSGSVAKQVADAKTELIGNANTDTAASNTIAGAKKHADTLNTAMDERVDALEKAIGESGSVNAQITKAIEALDVDAVGGTGKVITTVSETDGKIAATAIDLTAVNVIAESTLASDNAVAVTGTTVKDQIASLAASIKTVIKDAKSYSVKKLTEDEVTALGESNVREAYKLIDEDGTQVEGDTIKIYKDSSLKSVALDGQTLNFTYILADGSESTVGVDVSTFLAESEFGKGLEVVNHIVNVKVDTASEGFLTVGENGVKLSGVQEAINAAKTALIGGAADEYNTLGKLEDKIQEVDAKASGAHTVVNAKADGHVIVTIAKSGDSSHDIVTVTENDIASATDLTNEIAHRKAVTGIKGNAYEAHLDDTIIGTAADLDDADVKLATKLKAVSDDVDTIKGDKTFVKSLTVNNVPAVVANNAATVTIDGADIKLDGYTIASDGGALAPNDTVNAALGKIEYMLTWHEAN